MSVQVIVLYEFVDEFLYGGVGLNEKHLLFREMDSNGYLPAVVGTKQFE